MINQSFGSEEALNTALRELGCKPCHKLHRKGANEQFEIIRNYLATGKVPDWIVKCHEALLQNKEEDIISDVGTLLKKTH